MHCVAHFVNHLKRKPQACAENCRKSLIISEVKSSSPKFIDTAVMVYAFCRVVCARVFACALFVRRARCAKNITEKYTRIAHTRLVGARKNAANIPDTHLQFIK